MKQMSRLALSVVLAAGSVAMLPASAGATAQSVSQKDVTAATARYHSVPRAEAAGYSGAGEPCVSSPLGTMGIHYVNAALLRDDAVDPLRPEILLYVPKENGKLQLVGVEYWVRDADGDLTTDQDRPSLFGQGFDGPMPGHAPGMPVHYDLHLWQWQPNPAGTFAPFNPDLSC